MSHIFDALQRSKTEQTGIDFSPFSDATEFLRIAEHDTAAELGSSSPFGMPVTETTPEASQSSSEIKAWDAGADQFPQFKSLQISVPPKERLVCVTDPGGLVAEKFRFLSVRLREIRQKRQLRKVLITSAIPEEGKSMVAANLACALARKAQEKVLLIDGDLRRPSITRLFGLGKIPGIGEWLQGTQGADQNIYHLEGPNVWVLTAGNAPGCSMDLMQSTRIHALMDQLTSWFDWIVIDSPPILPMADTSIWMRMADGILLVTRQGVSEKRQLHNGLEILEPSKLIGAILNSATNVDNNNYYQYCVPKADQSKHHEK